MDETVLGPALPRRLLQCALPQKGLGIRRWKPLPRFPGNSGAVNLETPLNVGGVCARAPVRGLVTRTLQRQINFLRKSFEELERENYFYFSNSRNIELPVQSPTEENPDSATEDGLVKDV